MDFTTFFYGLVQGQHLNEKKCCKSGKTFRNQGTNLQIKKCQSSGEHVAPWVDLSLLEQKLSFAAQLIDK